MHKLYIWIFLNFCVSFIQSILYYSNCPLTHTRTTATHNKFCLCHSKNYALLATLYDVQCTVVLGYSEIAKKCTVMQDKRILTNIFKIIHRIKFLLFWCAVLYCTQNFRSFNHKVFAAPKRKNAKLNWLIRLSTFQFHKMAE